MQSDSTTSACQAAQAFRHAVVNEDLNIRDQIGTELDEFQALLKFGHLAVEPLLTLLGDEDGYVRYTIAGALFHFADDSRIVEPLIDALGDPEADVRAAAASPLGNTGHVLAVDALIAASQDPSPDVKFQAIQALRNFSDSRPAVAAVAAVMSDGEERNRLKASDCLKEMGAFAELRAAIDNGLDMEKQAIAQTLGETGGPGAFEHLILLLRSHTDEEEQNELMAAGLELCGDDQDSLGFLAECISGNDAYDQREAALALGKLGDLRAVEYLQSATEHPHFQVRTGGAQALHMLDAELGVRAMLRLLESPDESMLSWPGPIGFGSIGDRQVNDALIAMLSSTDGVVRRFAAKELAQTQDTRALEPLHRAAASGEALALKGLKSLGYKGPIDELLHAVTATNPMELLPVVRALRNFPDTGAVERLAWIARTMDGWVAEEAIDALGVISDPRATSTLADIGRNSSDARARQHAGWALTQMHTPEAEVVLLEALAKSDISAGSGAHAYYIAKGLPDSEGFLLDLIACHGHRAIAEDYAGCGNPTLASAGRGWLGDHPFAEYKDYDPWGKPSGATWHVM